MRHFSDDEIRECAEFAVGLLASMVLGNPPLLEAPEVRAALLQQIFSARSAKTIAIPQPQAIDLSQLKPHR